jgi:hypothetical protein
MSLSTQHIYRSANGDRWLLMTDTASGRKFVRHEANQSSGGRVTASERQPSTAGSPRCRCAPPMTR